ncbi:SCO family protein [Halalkalibacter akibai]|uniref:Cytochrome oxidase biogenesis protein Sco1/SenC/PrrC n=1 Tax=Halalkalibacter akibai (strain ATCC 43226 / DSM 21942 / CIP 109018 / JCM 9157 / 1139) TaxID=1236973 RepID=W4QTF1_HALA3|nr:SCO family protein [Halalkalibacter akibai]GAE35410.1 cytochrome oxidase biogenesis protein Sco1/SenC/PrrC [Halalkalibacter akibai JCM 9157]
MRVVLPLIMIALLSGCGWVYQVGSGGSSEYDISKAQMQIVDFEFTNQEGSPFGTNQLQGQYWLTNLIFTHCPTVCPTMTPNMQRLQAAMQSENIDMSFVSFTVDPERDTVEALKSYGTNVGADLESWHFLTGYTVDEIADFAGESLKTPVQHIDDSDDIVHTTSFFLIDPDGFVIRKYDGLQSNQETIIKDLIQTVKN